MPKKIAVDGKRAVVAQLSRCRALPGMPAWWCEEESEETPSWLSVRKSRDSSV
ncbi:MAG: hypothetical protein WAW75_02170 [Gallionella sp.]